MGFNRDIFIGEPIIIYREKITKKSKEFHTKSANIHNRILLYIEPLGETTERLIETGKINDLQNAKDRAKILREDAG
jgi:elongation factor 2